MENYQLLAVFSYPHELVTVKSLLESEGVDCYVKDELTVQVDNFVSNAIGGIRLLVHESNIERARIILSGNPFLVADNASNDFLEKFALRTNRIPILGALKTELRLLLLAALFFGALVFGIVIVMS